MAEKSGYWKAGLVFLVIGIIALFVVPVRYEYAWWTGGSFGEASGGHSGIIWGGVFFNIIVWVLAIALLAVGYVKNQEISRRSPIHPVYPPPRESPSETSRVTDGSRTTSSIEGEARDTTLYCPSCGREINAEWSVCPYCKANVKSTCPSCGKEVKEDWEICPFCKEDLKRSCPNCGESLKTEWSVCPYCKIKIS